MKYLAFATVVMALAGANPGQAGAQTISSFYTSTAPKACRMIGKPNEEDGSSTRVCPGKSGLVVLINEGDLREVVSVGRNRAAAAREPAAQAWFGPFSSTGDTIEWRAAGSKPFAIIQRWQIADNSEQDKRGGPVSRAMLAVTRLPPGEVCHVAYVDVAANPNANELARQAADDFARDFKCGADQVKTIGQSGRSTSLVTR
ncbi:hypothetical protein ACE10Z_17695 [Bradyrhizobium sp. Pha-3]|uniref:hypothetical protein n=1 Tax=Bradyrhizobium sp. Pha-3 TaxID=208375 RepID=UPI0035D46753